MTQSPGMDATSREEEFRTIFNSGTLKFEISFSELVIKRTKISGNERQVAWYDRVNDEKQIQRIKNKSENCAVRLGNEYIILEQRNAKNKLNGFCNVIKRSNAKEYKHFGGRLDVCAKRESDWMYYERRCRHNEI